VTDLVRMLWLVDTALFPIWSYAAMNARCTNCSAHLETLTARSKSSLDHIVLFDNREGSLLGRSKTTIDVLEAWSYTCIRDQFFVIVPDRRIWRACSDWSTLHAANIWILEIHRRECSLQNCSARLETIQGEV
jgi:hypothetical protein